jgi:outer membrane protein assembly factor BamB
VAVRHHHPRYAHRVEITVLDGDTGRALAGARVTVGRRSALTNREGVAFVPSASNATLRARAVARGYPAAAATVSFRRFPAYAFHLYRPSLQWPMYGADDARTQAQLQIHARPPFRLLWSRGLDGLIEFPAVVSNGKAYIGNARGTVFAIDMSNGSLVWRRPTPHGEMASSPAVWGDRIVVHGMDGYVRVLGRSDGHVLARYYVGARIESSPIVRDGIDYLGSWDGVVEALDLRRGRVLWRFPSGCKITSSAAIAGSTLYIGDYCGRLLALNRATGRLRWDGAVNGRIYGTPTVAGRRVFVGSSDGGSMNAFTTSGHVLWRRYFGSYVYSSPAAWGGRVFFGTYGGFFYGLNAATGATSWSVGAGGPISGAAVVVDGVAYAGSFAHRILGVDARSGRVLLDFPHGEYVPVSGGGRRLLLHGFSRVYAVAER